MFPVAATDKKTRMNIAVSPACKTKIQELAKKNHRSASQQAEHILETWYKSQNGNNSIRQND